MKERYHTLFQVVFEYAVATQSLHQFIFPYGFLTVARWWCYLETSNNIRYLAMGKISGGRESFIAPDRRDLRIRSPQFRAPALPSRSFRDGADFAIFGFFFFLHLSSKSGELAQLQNHIIMRLLSINFSFTLRCYEGLNRLKR